MKKNTKIMIFVIGTIISIVLILFSWYEIPRYMSISKGKKLNELTESYSSLEKVDESIIISVSTNDINSIRPMLISLLDQTVRVDRILINIVNSDKVINDEYKKIFSIYNSHIDYGYGNSIVPILLREKCDDTRIISVLNNIIYGKDFVETIVNVSNENPNCAIICNDDAILYKCNFYNISMLNADIKNNDKWCKSKLDTCVENISYKYNYKY